MLEMPPQARYPDGMDDSDERVARTRCPVLQLPALGPRSSLTPPPDPRLTVGPPMLLEPEARPISRGLACCMMVVGGIGVGAGCAFTVQQVAPEFLAGFCRGVSMVNLGLVALFCWQRWA